MSVKVLIIDDNPEYRKLLGHHITAEWPDAQVGEHDPGSNKRPASELDATGYDVVLLDHRLGDQNGLDWLQEFSRRPGFPPVIFLTDEGNEHLAVRAIKAGAEDYFSKKRIIHDHLIGAIREAVRKGKRKAALFEHGKNHDSVNGYGPVHIKGHKLVRQIATGSISSVYLSESADVNGLVVLKVLRRIPDDSEGKNAFERFIQEYEVISRIDHPNIVKIFGLGVADDHAFIAMEYFPAGDLKTRIRSQLDPQQALKYLTQMASALQAIHSVGVLHRDLKPANVMLRSNDTLALIDFGLAKQMRLDAELTDTGEIFGTPYYMSPEQGHAESVDERGDIYSLGVIFHEMLTGQKPYIAASPMAVIYKHSHASLPELPNSLRVFQPLIDTMMAKEPQDRCQSAEELLALVKRALA